MPKARKTASSMPPSAAMRQAELLKGKPVKKAKEVVVGENEDGEDVKPTISAMLPPPPPPHTLTSSDVKPSNMEMDELIEENEGGGDHAGRAKWATGDEDEKPVAEDVKPAIADIPCPHPELLTLIKQFEETFATQQAVSADITMQPFEKRIQNAVLAAQREATSKAMKATLERLGIRLPNIWLP
ncbi:hypothetical protein QFC22_005697 [Naganishia vaughanmartiniae]|uniref:Uncharacterized protein n=1 Tax=Naganishia vaughanmartiniae TaxID=1424756 RepID=A0ACC2WSE9_9TREE|nr:hypothetical protein QFC22_005697 [Naganishia vaughanmartiniae]